MLHYNILFCLVPRSDWRWGKDSRSDGFGTLFPSTPSRVVTCRHVETPGYEADNAIAL